jgi:type I restriction enzyme M protein
MALKKSELYSSLWASCDELRGGMDASQYKDYVLVLLFVKYVSDRFTGQPYAAITIPKGASFADMAALKGKPDIGDQINKKIIAPLASANKLSDFPDFNDAAKLGTARRWWTGSPISSPSSRTRLSTSPRTAPRGTTSSATPMNT